MLSLISMRRRAVALTLTCLAFGPAPARGAWPTETVATQTTGSTTAAIPMALAYRRGPFGGGAPQERIVIAYRNLAAQDLMVASRESTGLWTQTAVESSGDTGHDPDVAIDSSGYPHVVHYDSTNKRYRYARRSGTIGNCGPHFTWNCETIPVPAGYYLGSTAKIVIAADDRIHVAFRAATDNGYRFGYVSRLPGQAWSSVEWVLPPVATPAAALLSIGLDSANSPHLAFLGPSANAYQAFHWARRVSGSWVTEAAPGSWIHGGRMAIASNGHPRACLNFSPVLQNGTPPSVHRGVRNSDGTWTISLHIDDGGFCDIAVWGTQNYRRIVHSSASTGLVYFSQEMPLNPGTYFTLETVWAGTNPDMALDYQGKALVAFSYPGTGTVFFSRQP